MAISKTGVVYVADTGNNQVVTISSAGVATPVTVPGQTLSGPTAVALDTAGDLFIADSNNSRVLEVTTSGSTVQVAVPPTLSYPACLAFDPQGNLYIGDSVNLAVYKLTAAQLLAGSGLPATVSIGGVSNLFPAALAFDSSGDLFVADGNSNNLYELPSGQTAAKNVTPGGFSLSAPSGLGLDAAGNLYVLDSGNVRIVEIPQPAGSAAFQVPVTGLGVPSSLALDALGNLYITDVTNNNLTQLIYAGNPINLGSINAGAAGAIVNVNYELNTPETLTALQISMQGDAASEAIFNLGTTCKLQSYADSPTGSSNPITAANPFDCVVQVQGAPAYPGTRNGAINLLGSSNNLLSSVAFTETGSAAAAWIVPGVSTTAVSGLTQPQGLAVSADNGTVYIADYGSQQVYSWKGLNGTNLNLNAVSTGTITLSNPSAVALDSAGDLFIADEGQARVVVVPANTAIPPYVMATGSNLDHPISLAIDGGGNLYIGDAGPAGIDGVTSAIPGFVVKVPPSGGPITVLNTKAANLVFPQALAPDAAGNLYIADGGPSSGAGAGTGQIVLVPKNGAAPSVLSIPNLLDPVGVAVDPAGQLWVLDALKLQQLTIFPPGGSVYTVSLVAPNLVNPSLMAFTAGARSLLISDIGHAPKANELVLVSGLQAQLTFPQTAINTQSAAQAAAILSVGNTALHPANSGGNLYWTGGNTRDFQLQSGSTCLSFTQLLPAQSCSFSVIFSPVEPGVESETVTSVFNSAAQDQLLLIGSTTNSSSVTASPTLSPGSGFYSTAPVVTISDTTPGAVIYYTLNNTIPTTSSTVYHSPIEASGANPLTINAIALASGFTTSPVATGVYDFTSYLGNNAYSTAGTDTANYINATYAVTGNSSGGYTVSSCSFYQPSGKVTAGAKIDCGLILAPTPTTKSSSWLCHGTYSNPASSAVGGWITILLSGCGTLPPGTAYWISTDNNDPLIFPYGFWNCNGSCTGSAPTAGNGTYPYRYAAATYGQYTGMATAMSATSGTQASQFVTLGVNTPLQTATPTLSPGTGTYSTAEKVSLADATSGAVIYYTTDGSTPTTGSSVYTSAITVTLTTTINVLAVAPGYSNSAVASAAYTFNPYLGANGVSSAGSDTANYINATHAVTASSPHGYTVNSCSFYQPSGTVTQGAKVDCGLILAPTPTTQSSSWLCHATYTNPTTHGANAWITVSLSGCGTLPANTAYWISTDNNDHLNFPYGFWNCASSCSGSAPTVGAGTYPYRYISATYGQYTGMGTAMLATSGTQAAQYVTLAVVP